MQNITHADFNRLRQYFQLLLTWNGNAKSAENTESQRFCLIILLIAEKIVFLQCVNEKYTKEVIYG